MSPYQVAADESIDDCPLTEGSVSRGQPPDEILVMAQDDDNIMIY